MQLVSIEHRQRASSSREIEETQQRQFSLGEIVSFAAAIIVHLVYIFYVLWRMGQA